MPKRIIFPEKGRVVLESFELSIPEPEQIKVRTCYSLMSIGTESIILHQKYDPDTHFANMFSFPQLKTGVQAIGEVEETGRNVKEYRPGDIVYMREAHASHQVLAAAACSPVPPEMDLKSACWCGLAKTAFRAAWAGRLVPGQHVLVIGAGPVGQMLLRWASLADVDTLAVVDISSFRLEHASRGGATLTIAGEIEQSMKEIQAINDGEGPGIVIDTTGNAAVFKHALRTAGRFGKVILLGDCGYPSRQCLSSDVMTKGLSIQATHDSHDRDGWTQRKVDAHFFQQVEQGKFNLEQLISHEFTPDQCVDAYAQVDQRREETMGVLFDWSKEAY